MSADDNRLKQRVWSWLQKVKQRTLDRPAVAFPCVPGEMSRVPWQESEESEQYRSEERYVTVFEKGKRVEKPSTFFTQKSSF